MATKTTPIPAGFDRRLVYRPFLERLNSFTSPGGREDLDLIVPRPHDPRDPVEPPIHIAFANTAELTRGTQMALVGGIGSGKTTEMLLTRDTLARHSDAVNILVDLANYTDLSEIGTGAILAVAGLNLYAHQKETGQVSKEITAQVKRLREIAFGTIDWIEDSDYPDLEPDEDGGRMIPVKVRGVMKRRFPPLKRNIRELRGLLLSIAEPLFTREAQITFLIDGLDRLLTPATFRAFAEQDLQALRGTKLTTIIVAPLLLWYDNGRFLQGHFDVVKHIPSNPKDSPFLRQILEKRGALELMERPEVNTIVKYSGGVLRDLLTLARTAAEYAYREDQDQIGRGHVRAAVQQLGNRYLAGLGNSHKMALRRLLRDHSFAVESTAARELLVNGQVLEQVVRGHQSFTLHPALQKVLPPTNPP